MANEPTRPPAGYPRVTDAVMLVRTGNTPTPPADDGVGSEDGDDGEEDFDYCPKSADHKHFLDKDTLAPADGYDTKAEGGVVFNISCLHCGRSGSGRIDLPEVMW